jgi:hypothetical protein
MEFVADRATAVSAGATRGAGMKLYTSLIEVETQRPRELVDITR